MALRDIRLPDGVIDEAARRALDLNLAVLVRSNIPMTASGKDLGRDYEAERLYDVGAPYFFTFRPPTPRGLRLPARRPRNLHVPYGILSSTALEILCKRPAANGFRASESPCAYTPVDVRLSMAENYPAAYDYALTEFGRDVAISSRLSGLFGNLAREGLVQRIKATSFTQNMYCMSEKTVEKRVLDYWNR